jgi:hypothetical protein
MEDNGARPTGFLYQRIDDPMPPGQVADPLSMACMFRGKPIWAFKSGPAPSGAASDRGSGSQVFVVDPNPRPPLLERVRLVVAAGEPGLSQDLKAYDLLVFEQDELVSGISLTANGRSFDRLDFFNRARKVIMTQQVLQREALSGLPTEWSCDVLSPEGRWVSGYVANVTSWNREALPKAAFAPHFPADAIVFEREIGMTIDPHDVPDSVDRLATLSLFPEGAGSKTRSGGGGRSESQQEPRLTPETSRSAEAQGRTAVSDFCWLIGLAFAAAVGTAVIIRRRKSA